jgi:hypothetical protein
MRTRALRGCLIVVFAICVILLENIGSVAKKREKPQPNAKQSQQQPEADKRGTIDAPFIIKSLPAEKNHQEADDEARDKNDKRWNDRATIFVAIATAVILILQLIVFGWQAHRLKQTIQAMKTIGADQSRDMRASIAVAKESAEAAMKSARVSEIALESAETPYLYPTVMTACKHKEWLLFSYAFENFGRSPAIVREIYDGPTLSSGLPAAIGFPPPQSNLGKSYVVAVGKHSPDRNMAISFPIGDGQNAAVWLMGQVRYSDVFGNQFLSGFCFSLNPVSVAFTTYGGAGYNYRRKLTDQERQIAETRDADPLVAAAP